MNDDTFPLAYEAEDCYYAVAECRDKGEELMKKFRAILHQLPSREGSSQQIVYTFPDSSWLEVWWLLKRAVGHPKQEARVVQCYRIEYSPGQFSEECFATQGEAKRFLEKK